MYRGRFRFSATLGLSTGAQRLALGRSGLGYSSCGAVEVLFVLRALYGQVCVIDCVIC